ncbi:MAG: DotU family type IV/VI secretion system protein [Phycisphaerales bacterium]
MTLTELCEPLFQYVCRLSRTTRKSIRVEPATVRSEVTAILADMKAKAGTERNLVSQYEKVELALIFFVDFMARECLRGVGKWSELAADRKELAGDERFFDLLEETLKEPGEAATERLGVFYTCLGLGFTGWYAGQPEYLRKKMLEISARTRGMMDTDPNAKICPEAYEHVNTSNFIEPPGKRLIGVAIVLVGLFILVVGLNISLYYNANKRVNDAVKLIVQKGKVAAE